VFKKRNEKIKKPEKELIKDPIALELYIDIENLGQETAEQPLRLRKWSKLKAEVSEKARAIEQKVKEVEAKAYLYYAGGGGKVKEIESKVNADKEVINIRKELREALKLEEEYKGIVGAFKSRDQALNNLSADRRGGFE